MADLKISQLGPFSETDVVASDVLALADVSAEQTKKISASDLVKAGARLNADTITFGNDVVVTGDFTVNGTETIINTETLEVEDKNVVIGKVTTPTDLTADGGGITLKGTTDKTFNWVDATDAWTSSEHLDLASNKSIYLNGFPVVAFDSSYIFRTGAEAFFFDSTETYTVSFTAPTTIAASVSWTLPGADGTSGQLLSTDGSGNLSWATPAATGVTSVTGTSPISSSGGNTPDISIQDATTAQKGAVQLEDSTSSTSTTTAATPNSVKSAYDLANAALPASGGTVTGDVTLNAQSDLRFADSDSSNWVALQAPATVASNVTWTLPDADGTSGQVLSTNGTGTLSWATAAGGATDKIEEGNTSAEVIDTGSDGRFVVTTEGSERLRVDSSGRLGIGTTSPQRTLSVSKAGAEGVEWNPGQSTNVNTEVHYNRSGAAFCGLSTQAAYHIFDLASSEGARIDSSGRLLVGTSSARANFFNGGEAGVFQVEGTSGTIQSLVGNANSDGGNPAFVLAKSRGTSVGSTTVLQSGDRIGRISFQGSDGTEFVQAADIYAEVDGTPGANDMPGRLVFSTTADGASSPTERMRITNDGRTHLFASSGDGHSFRTALSAGASDALVQGFYGASSTTSGSICFAILTNGNVQNTNNSYTAISDIKLKENIVDANSQWDDIKALRVRNYNLKEGQTHTQIGLIAQEVELVSPGLVSESPDRDEDGNDLGTVTKSVNYSVLYMKAVKALQEAMERIEVLEAKVNALEGK